MKRLLGAAALVCFGAFSLFAQSAGVLPIPEQQFFDANGLPLAGGYIYTCVAGTSCPGNPLAAYTDATGTTALPNPIVLDSGGRASIWLGTSAYKIVAEDASGVTQWTADQVAIPGLSLLAGTGTLSALTVTGNATIGGTLAATGAVTFAGTVSAGALTAASGGAAGAWNVGSFVDFGAATVNGNVQLGGTLGVQGIVTSDAAVNAQSLTSQTTIVVNGAATVGSLTTGQTGSITAGSGGFFAGTSAGIGASVVIGSCTLTFTAGILTAKSGC